MSGAFGPNIDDVEQFFGVNRRIGSGWWWPKSAAMPLTTVPFGAPVRLPGWRWHRVRDGAHGVETQGEAEAKRARMQSKSTRSRIIAT